MVVGYGIINLRIPESGSLKSKRSVLNRILKRTQNEFNVSIAETGHLDNYKLAEISFAVVGNDSRYIGGKMDLIFRFIDNLHVAEITGSKTEIMVVTSFLETADWEIKKYDEF
ncbi:MAG: DUF503 domain-containing protein [Deltaproteobacteria bacterium]|nr:DUF503 domain-containing protein [Deltaproteobacteria bacterium]